MISAPLQADTLKDLREHASTFIKLDLAYLAGAAALFTAFKLSTDELPNISVDFFLVAIVYYAICAFDVFVFSIIFIDWINCKTESSKRVPAWMITWPTTHQAVVHLIFLGGLGSLGMGMLHGIHRAREEWQSQAIIQEQVEAHILKKGRVPESVSQLDQTHSLRSALEKIKNQPILIEPDELEVYKLTFSGSDGKLGTSDDFSVTQAFSLKLAWDKSRGSGKSSP